MESLSIKRMRKKIPTLSQKEFVVGTLLGDGYLMKTTRGYCLRIHHGKKQKQFIDWKYALMKDFVNTPPRFDGNGFYFRTVSNPVFIDYHEIFYKNGIKILPENIDQLLSPFGLAIWIMDDGSRSKGCIRIHSYNFSYDEHLRIQKLLDRKFSIKCNIHRDKGMFRLWIRSESIPTLMDLVESYFIPSMSYKLPRNDFDH